MQQAVETAGIYALLAFIWIVVPAYVIRKLWRRRYPSKHARAEPVESNLPRVRREPVTEIEAEYGRDYRGPGRPGEPMFPPGALLGLLALIATFVGGALYSHYGRAFLEPIVDPIVRSVFPTSR